MTNIPDQLICTHILPKLDSTNYLLLFRKALSNNDHHFIINYIIESYKFIDHSTIFESNENFILMEEIVTYAIKYLNEEELFHFIYTIKFPHLCTWNREYAYKYWKDIIERENINILQFFLCCNNSIQDALFYAIDNKKEIFIKFIIDNGFAEYMTFKHFLKILPYSSNTLWNSIISLIDSNEIYRKYISYEANMYYKFIQDSLSDIKNISLDETFYSISLAIKPNNKKSKKIRKKLKRFQKSLKIPGLYKLISFYFDKVEYIDE